jgi:hypothetical protein
MSAASRTAAPSPRSWPISSSRLAAGHADQLSGCHLSVHDDLDAILAAGPGARDRYQLRFRGREDFPAVISCLPFSN